MDVNQWKDPDIFRPERFLDSAGNIINKDSVIAFSIGLYLTKTFFYFKLRITT